MSLVARLHDLFEERRRDNRERVLFPAELAVGDRVVRCVLLDISKRGAMLASVEPPKRGVRAVLQCHDINSMATIRWVHHYQFGIVFDHWLRNRQVAALIEIAGGKGAGR